jgi:hypothetical protein
MGNVTRLDRVSVFGNALSFLIPHDWIEGQSEDDHYLYHLPEAECGWLRVSLISIKVPKGNLSGKLDEIFEGDKHVTIEEQTGNRVCTWEKDSEEDGIPTRLFTGRSQMLSRLTLCARRFSLTLSSRISRI